MHTGPRRLRAAAALAALLATPQIALAWGHTGHRIAAQVAQGRLSPPAAAAVEAIAGRRSLAMLAAWPDFIRSEPAWGCVEPWHYLTVEDGQEFEKAMGRAGEPGRTCKLKTLPEDVPNNVVAAIRYFDLALRGDRATTESFARFLETIGAQPWGADSRSTDEERRRALRLTTLAFLVHFVGDVHQPLHVGRGGDGGGNSVSVNWFGTVEKLHAVWDEKLIENEGLSFTEFASFLEAELGGEVEAGSLEPAEWARESIVHRSAVYEIWQSTSRENHLPDLGYAYAHDQIGVVKQRLYQAGRRLAALLNAIFE